MREEKKNSTPPGSKETLETICSREGLTNQPRGRNRTERTAEKFPGLVHQENTVGPIEACAKTSRGFDREPHQDKSRGQGWGQPEREGGGPLRRKSAMPGQTTHRKDVKLLARKIKLKRCSKESTEGRGDETSHELKAKQNA